MAVIVWFYNIIKNTEKSPKIILAQTEKNGFYGGGLKTGAKKPEMRSGSGPYP